MTSSGTERPAEAGASGRSGTLAALLVCCLLALWWAPGVSMESTTGWDESINGAFPSARLALSIRAGSFDEPAGAIHDCTHYPFVYPALLGALQTVVGVSEHACRVFGRVLWCAGLFGLFLLARQVVALGGGGRRGDHLVPWIALALGALSPLALAYSGALLLELPFAVCSIFTLRAWLRRGADEPLRRELAAGAWLMLIFFTKFNFGLLLGFALFLDLLVEAVVELRAGRGRRFRRRTLSLAAIPIVSLLWWFVLPLPFGAEVARAHWEGFTSFLGSSRDEALNVPWSIRVIHWTCFLVHTPRTLLLILLAMLATLPRITRRPIRTLWIVFLAAGLPVWTHNYHIDRYLLPGAVLMWCLAACGLAPLLPVRPRWRAVAIGALAAATLLFPASDGWFMLETVGIAREKVADYQRRVLAEQRSLAPGRNVPSNGLYREELEACLDLLEPEVTPGTRVAWMGASNIFSPAAMHVGLVERGAGSPEAILDGTGRYGFLDTGFVDPGWTAERILEWADGFDLILATDPVDLLVPHLRSYFTRYHQVLIDDERWQRRLLGTFEKRHPNGKTVPVSLYGFRRTP